MRRHAVRFVPLFVWVCPWRFQPRYVSFAQAPRKLDVLKQKLSEAVQFIEETKDLPPYPKEDVIANAMWETYAEETIEQVEKEAVELLKKRFAHEIPQMPKEYVDVWLARQTLIRQYLGFVYHDFAFSSAVHAYS